MGASIWDYRVPYTGNPAESLAALQRKVFNDREYLGNRTAASIDELRLIQADEGTHSILDIIRLDPNEYPYITEERLMSEFLNAILGQHDDNPVIGTIFKAREDQILALFGNGAPSVDLSPSLMLELARGTGIYATLYTNDQPAQYFFYGVSGD